MTNRELFKGKGIDAFYQYLQESAAGLTREQMVAGKTGDALGRMFDLATEDEPEPEPPQPPNTHRLKEFAIDGMGIYTNFMRDWWNPVARPFNMPAWDKLMAEYARHRVWYIHFFLWVNDGKAQNAYINKYGPYLKLADGSYDLAAWEEKFWRCYTAWLELLKKHGLQPVCCTHMDTYTVVPYAKNVNGVAGMWDEAAEPFIHRLALKAIRLEKQIFGAGHAPHHRGMNEARPHGDAHEWDHIIADWHMRYYRAIAGEVARYNFHIDSSLRESAHAQFMPRHACSKCRPGDMYGDGHYGGHADLLNPNGKPDVNIINHGYSIKENLQEPFYKWMNSPVHSRPAKPWLGGDGGAGPELKYIARGFKIYTPDGHLLWAQGDAAQTKQLVITAMTEALAKGKQLGYQLAHFEALLGWPLQEKYRVSTIDWQRVAACRDGIIIACGYDNNV